MTAPAATVTGKDLIARVTALAPLILERCLKAAADRKADAEVIAALIDAKVFRACQPKRFGGFELPFGTHTDIAIEIGR